MENVQVHVISHSTADTNARNRAESAIHAWRSALSVALMATVPRNVDKCVPNACKLAGTDASTPSALKSAISRAIDCLVISLASFALVATTLAWVSVVKNALESA